MLMMEWSEDKTSLWRSSEQEGGRPLTGPADKINRKEKLGLTVITLSPPVPPDHNLHLNLHLNLSPFPD